MTEAETRVRKITAVLLGSSALGLLVWDVYVANNDLHNDTISELVRDLSHRFYSLPFTLMVVMGHLFWNQPQEARLSAEERAKIFWTRVVPTVLLLIVRDVVNLVVPLPTFAYANLAVGAAGFGVGARFWPQAMPAEAPPPAPPTA